MRICFLLKIKFILVGVLVTLLLTGLTPIMAQSGNCTNETPFFSVDLRGQPGGSFTTPNVDRDGNCCGSAANTNCVEFEIFLDPRASGLAFDITAGPEPSGSMFYQINCGTPISVGDSTCADGSGPQLLTICMPGSANNQYTVYSVVAFEETADISVTEGCSGIIAAPIAFDPTSVTYNDITGGGPYNSYLSCLSGCAETTVTPDAGAPSFVDYTVCGNSNNSNCTSTPFCDTVRVNFHPRIQVSVDPSPALICQNGTTTLQGVVAGGSGGPYSYFWYDAADGTGNVVGNSVNYIASTAGTYSFEVRNENYPNCEPFIANVDVNDNFSISAGADQTVCPEAAIQLNGSVQGATGGLWSGGNGLFTPDNQTLNATYTPTQTEIDAGSLTLILTSTGNGNCTAGTDQISITFYEAILVTIDGPPTLCNNNTSTIQATVSGGSGNYGYLWSTGETTSSVTKPAGTYSVTVTDITQGCQSDTNITITQSNGPTSLNASSTASSCGNSNGLITVDAVIGGIAPYEYAMDGGVFQSSNIFNAILAGVYTISAKDANGCIISSSVTVTDIAGPSDFTSTMTQATCGGNDGSIAITGVTDGLAPFQYALDNGSFQAGTSFNGLSAGSYQVKVRDVNNCEFIKSVSVTNNEGPNAITYGTTAANCGQSDGTISINSVTGGDAPFSYSIDSINFQSSNLFSGLAFGSFDVTVQDSKGCIYSEMVLVPSEGPETMEVQVANTVCSLDNGAIDITSVSGGTAPYTYSLDGATYQSASTFGNLSIGDYTVYVQDNKGCVLIENASIIDVPGPQDLSFTLADATCGQPNGQFVADAVIGGTAPYSYALDGGAFQSSDTFQGISASSHSVTVRDANNCEFNVSFDINNIPGPTEITAVSTPSECNQSNGNIVATIVIGGTAPFLYSLDGTNFQSEQIFSGLPQGLYTLVARDDNGCEVSTSVDVLNIDGPQSITTTIVNETCGNSDGSINITTVDGGFPPYIYAIDNNDFQNSPDFTGLMAATYSIYVKDANDCVYLEQLTVGSNGPTAVNYRSSAASCNIDDGSLTVDQVVGGSSPYSYTIDGVNFQNTNSFNNLAAGIYALTIIDANSCTYTESVTIDGQGPAANLDQLVHISCFGSADGTIAISASSPNIPLRYSIDAGVSFQSTGDFVGLLAGTYTIMIVDDNGCTTSINNLEIVEPELLAAQASILQMPDPGLSNGIAFLNGIDGGIPPYNTSLDGQAMGQDTLFQNLSSGMHTITLEDQNQCLLSFEVSLEGEEPEIEIPNGFTPNGDGMNDTWELIDLNQLYPNAQIKVFNRWGQMVFSSKGYVNPWNGKRQDKDLPTAAYYYVINLSNDIDPLQGTVTIIR